MTVWTAETAAVWKGLGKQYYSFGLGNKKYFIKFRPKNHLVNARRLKYMVRLKRQKYVCIYKLQITLDSWSQMGYDLQSLEGESLVSDPPNPSQQSPNSDCCCSLFYWRGNLNVKLKKQGFDASGVRMSGLLCPHYSNFSALFKKNSYAHLTNFFRIGK